MSKQEIRNWHGQESLEMTDEDLRKDTSSVDRSQLNTYHF